MRGLRRVFVATLIAGVALAGGVAQAAKFKVLHSFCSRTNCGDGSNPAGALAMDQAGNFFGTTLGGGGRGDGTAFELVRQADGHLKFKPIFHFCSACQFGSRPNGALIIDTQGNLYGTANNLVFELSPVDGQKRWSEKILYRFCSQQRCTDGDTPVGGLTYAGASSGAPYDGVSPLYGVTNLGGANDEGVVFNLSANNGQWTESVLYSFCSAGGKCLDGAQPAAGLIMDAEGNIFGTTASGGGNDPQKGGQGAGVVFELSPENGGWSISTIYRFCAEMQCADGAFPAGELTFDETGALIGTTRAGGKICKLSKTYGCGTIFKLSSDGSEFQESVQYSFCNQRDCRDGALPLGAVLLVNGSGMGTTQFGGGNDIDKYGSGGGTAYEVTGSTLKTWHRFCSVVGCADGEYPEAGLVADGSGGLYGSTSMGGADSGGAIFRLNP
jgi:hypothetical protein